MSRKFRKQLYDFMTLSANDSEGDLWVYGDIADDKWYDNDVTPNTIRDSLNEMGNVGTLNLRINSYGGSCVAGNTIVNIIDNYKRKTGAKVHAYIDGIAASMGSGIAMAADYIFMAENAIFMVHKPFSVAVGNSDDMEKEKEILDKVEDTLVKNYMRHFNGTEDEMRQLMADESWLTADEALEYGLCDEIVPAVAVAASAKGIRINNQEFSHEELKDRFKETEVENVFEYDDRLNEYGIDEEDFNDFGIDANTALIVASSVTKPKNLVKVKNKFWTNEDDICSDEDEIIHLVSQVKNALGKVVGPKEILDLAKAGMNIDPAIDNKAKEYDKLVNAAIEDAIKSGIKAKGDSFNDTKWKKILNGLDYSEIIDQKNEWEAEAKLVLKAGKRISQVKNPDNHGDSSAVNLDDFKL